MQYMLTTDSEIDLLKHVKEHVNFKSKRIWQCLKKSFLNIDSVKFVIILISVRKKVKIKIVGEYIEFFYIEFNRPGTYTYTVKMPISFIYTADTKAIKKCKIIGYGQ